MSRSTNSIVRSVNFCEVCDLVFETKKELYKHQSYDIKHKELIEKIFEFDNDDDLIYVKSKTESKTKTVSKAKKLKPKLKPN